MRVRGHTHVGLVLFGSPGFFLVIDDWPSSNRVRRRQQGGTRQQKQGVGGQQATASRGH